MDIRRAFELISSLDAEVLKHQGRKSEIVVIDDWRFDRKRGEYHILINRADRDVPDVALKNFRTHRVRYAGKTKEEGIDVSTHVIVRLNKEPNAKTALVLVTQGGGMTMTRLERLFGVLIRLVKSSQLHDDEFVIAHPSGAKDDTYKISYRFDVTAHKSSHLDQCLKQGRFLGMELITLQDGIFDSGGNLQVKQNAISLVPAANSKLITLSTIKNAITKAGSQFHQAKIKFKMDDGTPRIETFEVDDLDAAFTKRVWLRFETDIPSHTTEIDDTVIDKMIQTCK